MNAERRKMKIWTMVHNDNDVKFVIGELKIRGRIGRPDYCSYLSDGF